MQLLGCREGGCLPLSHLFPACQNVGTVVGTKLSSEVVKRKTGVKESKTIHKETLDT